MTLKVVVHQSFGDYISNQVFISADRENLDKSLAQSGH